MIEKMNDDVLPGDVKALFALDEAPAHDTAFALDVLARIERRQFRAALGEGLSIALAVGVLTILMVLILPLPPVVLDLFLAEKK